jgi:hypothetical protein
MAWRCGQVTVRVTGGSRGAARRSLVAVKMMLTSPRMPKPTATSVSVARVLATLAPVVIRDYAPARLG